MPAPVALVTGSTSSPTCRRKGVMAGTTSAKTRFALLPRPWRRIASTLSSASVDLRLLVVTAVDQDFLPVGLIDYHRLEQIGRHHLHTIFVGGGVVHRHGLAAQRRVHHVGGDLGEVAGVLEDR